MTDIISNKKLEELFLMKAEQHGQERHLIKLFIQRRPDLVLEYVGLIETAYFMDYEFELLPG